MLSSNGISRKPKVFSASTPIISCISEELNVLTCDREANGTRIIALRKNLRRVQRKAIFHSERRRAKKFDRLLYEDR